MKKITGSTKFSHKDNRCLHCTSDHETHDCPTRLQPQAPTASNPARTNPPFQQNFQQQPPAPVPQVNQQMNYQVRPQQFNQQFSQPPLPQVSPLLMPPQPFNPQVPPPYFPQYPPSNNPSVGSNDSFILVALQKQ